MYRTTRPADFFSAHPWPASLAPIRGPLCIATTLAVVACVFWPTVRELVGLGEHADSRLALVGPAFLAIAWLRRDEFAVLPVRPCWSGLVALAGLGTLWLIGELVYARILTDVAVTAMVPVVILAVFGYRWLSALAFALLLFLFAIPFDAALVPLLVRWTTEFAVLALKLSGIAVQREGSYLAIASGNWAVADTCSGVDYLATCLMLGLLYAWLFYRPTWKRIVFICGAILIGIVGNWIRVYLTIVIAHVSHNHLLRDDHSAFGWVLYAIFLLAYGRFGYGLRDRYALSKGGPLLPTSRDSIESGCPARRVVIAAMATLALLMVWPFAEWALTRPPRSAPSDIADIVPQNGWSRASAPAVAWTPTLHNPTRTRVQTFEKSGRRIDVFVGLFHRQSWSSKLVSVNNRLVGSGPGHGPWALSERGVARTSTIHAGIPLDVETGTIIGPGIRLRTWRWYWIDGRSTASGMQAKLGQLLGRLAGKDDASAWISICTRADLGPDSAADILETFMRDMGDSLDRALPSSARSRAQTGLGLTVRLTTSNNDKSGQSQQQQQPG